MLYLINQITLLKQKLIQRERENGIFLTLVYFIWQNLTFCFPHAWEGIRTLEPFHPTRPIRYGQDSATAFLWFFFSLSSLSTPVRHVSTEIIVSRPSWFPLPYAQNRPRVRVPFASSDDVAGRFLRRKTPKRDGSWWANHVTTSPSFLPLVFYILTPCSFVAYELFLRRLPVKTVKKVLRGGCMY